MRTILTFSKVLDDKLVADSTMTCRLSELFVLESAEAIGDTAVSIGIGFRRQPDA